MVWISARCVQAETHAVRSASEVESLVKSGVLSAGDTIVWADGEYDDETLNLEGVHGDKGDPITLRAETPGKVILRGRSQFSLGTQWWVIQGFHFDGSSGGTNSYNAVQFRSQGGTGARNVRLTNCAFTNLTVKGSSSKWILLYGTDNRIDHCHFSGKNSKGALLTVELGDLAEKETADHCIEWNYFGDFSAQDGTDNETIRVGSSEDQDHPATCLIRRNLFVRCDGENEVISNKSSFNTYFANTFRQCNGALVLRHGHHVHVEGNYFFGEGASDAGGLRIVDSHHVVINNYMQDLTGTTWNSALSILGGRQTSGGSGNGYQAVDEIVIAYNTIINCQRSIYFNDAKGSRPPTGVMANNLVSGSSSPLVLAELSANKMQWTGNLFHGVSVGADVQAIIADPVLSSRDGLFRPSSSGPAADAADSNTFSVKNDIDGQARPESNTDIGADEVAGETGSVERLPLESTDVGVDFPQGTARK